MSSEITIIDSPSDGHSNGDSRPTVGIEPQEASAAEGFSFPAAAGEIGNGHGAHDGASGQRTAAAEGEPATALYAGQMLLDRFEIKARLGRGGFGAVYAAYDHQLKREVAIKQSRALKSFVAGQIREEARMIASLNHPNIVQIHDLIRQSDQEWLIVMECLKGIPLSQYIRQVRLSIVDAVKLSLQLADALGHAHQRQLVHSDVKPANLLVCDHGRLKLLDFGLTVAYSPERGPSAIGGTPGYMSPEQIRGESHLIDGRTDIWAFGVLMYEMLTGERPFSASDRQTTNARTLFQLAPSPCHLNAEIDEELQRIILKCLEPLITSRYASVATLREDLVHWLQVNSVASPGQSLDATQVDSSGQIVPSALRLSHRGLQPFIEADASVYLSVIPGPRDRNGIPDSIRFWHRWVESDDPNTEHPVGVLYGPSGSGKTSFIRAGLFRQLSADICRVYIECRPGDLGGRLTRIIETQLNNVSGESSLRDLLCRFRSEDHSACEYKKLLIVLDQFESWAHSATLEERLDLAEALRQCDGIQIRSLLVTRDDFWMGVKELLHWLEIPMREGRNVASVELLTINQAEQILEAMGRELCTLPDAFHPLSDEQRQFISQSVTELAMDGRVICVHLVMFAQMVKRSQWTPQALHESGGVVGACSLFFHELFEKSGGHSPEFNRIAPAVPAVLAKLIPVDSDSVVNVCEDRQSIGQALDQIGQTHLLDDCLAMLCEDLRIISIVSADQETQPTIGNQDQPNHLYRLSHDFLVEPISTYLTRVQRRNWQSRTKTRLGEMSNLWTKRQSNAYMPGFMEYVMLAGGTIFQKHCESESRFLRAATKHHAGRISVAIVALLGFLCMSLIAWSQWNAAAESRTARLNTNVARLLDCPAKDFSAQMASLTEFGPETLEAIDVWKESTDAEKRFRANLYRQAVRRESFADIAPLIGDAPSELFDAVLGVAAQTPDWNATLGSVFAKVSAEQAAENIGGEARARNRAAITLAYLGDSTALVSLLSGSDDLVKDQAILMETTRWRGDPKLWADLITQSDSPDVRYHAAAVLAGYPPEQLQRKLLKLDFQSLVNSSSASTHSMGRFLVKQTGGDVYSIALQPPAVANWRVGPDQISMVRFEPTSFQYQPRQAAVIKLPLPEKQYAVEQSFWLATTPVSEAMYQQFADGLRNEGSEFDTSRKLESFNLPDYLQTDPRQPAVAVSLGQAYMFCNWLSRREGLQECYTARAAEAVSDDDLAYPPIPWAFDADANGFRVPTDDEFRLIAHCGYRQPDSRHAIELAVASGQSRRTPIYPRELFTLIPNRSGIFLMDEFCGTWVCGDDVITGFHVSERGIIKGIHRELNLPVGGIFIAQNAAADQGSVASRSAALAASVVDAAFSDALASEQP